MTPDDLPFVSVVIPARNVERTLGGCLRALQRLDYPEARREIVVVENGSSDATPAIARAAPVRVITEPRRGASAARNRGIRESRGTIVALLDADCYATTGWLVELVSALADERVAAASGEVVAYPPRTPAEHYAARRKPLWQEVTRRRRPRAWMLTGNTAVRREVFERVGLFDTRFTACEDIDFAWRFFNAGLEAVHRPKAVVFHHHRATARDLFRQHVSYGKGQRLLHGKYPEEIGWSGRAERDAWIDLGRSAWGLTRSWVRSLKAAGDAGELQYSYLDLVRKLGQRAGFVQQSMTERLRPGRTSGSPA